MAALKRRSLHIFAALALLAGGKAPALATETPAGIAAAVVPSGTDFADDSFSDVKKKMKDLSRGHVYDPTNDVLNAAIYSNDIKEVERLLDQGANPNRVDEKGGTALRWAAQWGRTDAVRLLLDRGADVNHADKNGITAMMVPASVGNSDMVELLLNKGADPKAKEFNGTTILMMASGAWGSPKAVGLLLDKGVDPNAKNEEDETALMWAAKNGRLDAVKLLLDKCADIEAVNAEGKTARQLAVSRGFFDIGRLIGNYTPSRACESGFLGGKKS